MHLSRIGNLIKDARIGKNQSVNELASNLKISEQQLIAIEEGRDDLLPEKVFVKAMIKKISESLQLDTKDIVDEFNSQKEQIKVEEIIDEVKTKTKSRPLISFRFLLNIFISGLVGFIASSFMFNLLFDSNNESETSTIIKGSR